MNLFPKLSCAQKRDVYLAVMLLVIRISKMTVKRLNLPNRPKINLYFTQENVDAQYLFHFVPFIRPFQC